MKRVKHRVLHVEDDPGFASLVSRWLPLHDVVHAETLSDAAAVLEEAEQFDSVLLDLGLPDATGLEALHAVLDGRSLPVVVATGQDHHTWGPRAIAAGAQDFLPKARMDAFVLERVLEHAIERFRLNAKLRDSERRLRAVARHAPGHLLLVDRHARIEFVNRVRTDEQAVDWVGRSLVDFVAEGDRPMVREALAQALAGAPASYSVATANGEGLRRHFDTRLAPVPGPDGSTTHVVVHAADVTQSKERESMLRLIFDTSPWGLLALGRAGEVVACNQQACALLQAEHDEMVGRPLQEVSSALVAASRRHARSSGTWDQQKRPGPQVFEFTVAAGDEACARRPVRVFETVAPGGSRVARVLALVDLSETADQEARIRRMQKMEVVGQLAGGVAHDFNNLLSVVLGSAGALEELVGPESHGLLEEITEAAERGALLTRRLLAFARAAPSVPAAICPLRESRRVATLMRRVMGRAVTLQVLGEPRPDHVVIDPVAFEQLMVNLMVNARDAVGAGGGRVEVSIFAEGPHVVIDVDDDGPGIAEVASGSLFEPFFTTKGDEDGTGLGLATCYAIVTEAGGSIVAESSALGGARFRVRLPRVPRPSRRASEQRRVDESEWRLDGISVILVEDEPVVRRVVRRQLQKLGATVATATGLSDARALLSSLATPPDALLSDVVMPDGNGAQVAAAAAAHFPSLPIVFVTGFDAGVLSDMSALPERASVLQKPFSPRDLGLTIKRVMRTTPRSKS